MSVGVPALPLGLDPLIAEARDRARRRRFLLGGVALVAAAAIGATVAAESGGAATGLCATAPSGWKELSLPKTPTKVATVVLTNWRFGTAGYGYGLFLPPPWPRSAVIVSVSNDGPAATPRFRSALQVSRGEFTGFEGMRYPAAQTAIHVGSRVLAAYVEVGALTPATVAAANRALAGVHACSA